MDCSSNPDGLDGANHGHVIRMGTQFDSFLYIYMRPTNFEFNIHADS